MARWKRLAQQERLRRVWEGVRGSFWRLAAAPMCRQFFERDNWYLECRSTGNAYFPGDSFLNGITGNSDIFVLNEKMYFTVVRSPIEIS